MNANESAYPNDHRAHGEKAQEFLSSGLTKCEAIAKGCYEALLSNPAIIGGSIDLNDVWLAAIAIEAVKCADALIAELSKEQAK